MPSKQWKFKAVVTNKQGWGGYYGYGDTPEEALANCEKAAGNKQEWRLHNRRVVIEIETGKEVLRQGKP